MSFIVDYLKSFFSLENRDRETERREKGNRKKGNREKR